MPNCKTPRYLYPHFSTLFIYTPLVRTSSHIVNCEVPCPGAAVCTSAIMQEKKKMEAHLFLEAPFFLIFSPQEQKYKTEGKTPVPEFWEVASLSQICRVKNGIVVFLNFI